MREPMRQSIRISAEVTADATPRRDHPDAAAFLGASVVQSAMDVQLVTVARGRIELQTDRKLVSGSWLALRMECVHDAACPPVEVDGQVVATRPAIGGRYPVSFLPRQASCAAGVEHLRRFVDEFLGLPWNASAVRLEPGVALYRFPTRFRRPMGATRSGPTDPGLPPTRTLIRAAAPVRYGLGADETPRSGVSALISERQVHVHPADGAMPEPGERVRLTYPLSQPSFRSSDPTPEVVLSGRVVRLLEQLSGRADGFVMTLDLTPGSAEARTWLAHVEEGRAAVRAEASGAVADARSSGPRGHDRGSVE